MRGYYFVVSHSKIPQGAVSNPTRSTNPRALNFPAVTDITIFLKFQSRLD